MNLVHTQNVRGKNASHQRTVKVWAPYQNHALGALLVTSCTTAEAYSSGFVVAARNKVSEYVQGIYIYIGITNPVFFAHERRNLPLATYTEMLLASCD